MKRITTFDRTRGVYVIEPDATGNHIQKLGTLEDRDEPRRNKYADSKSPDADFECGACGADVGSSYNFCPWCGQRLQNTEVEEDGA